MPISAHSTRKVYLIGMMGSGKTTVGRLLAERLGYPYLDSDEQVEAATGRTVREIFETDGEPAFRAEERKALVQAITRPGPAVVAVAGGAIINPDNRRRLQDDDGVVVWLRAPVHVLAGRVDVGDHRPLLGDDPEGNLGRLYGQRRPMYEDLAEIVVDVAALDPQQAVDAIVEQLGQPPS